MDPVINTTINNQPLDLTTHQHNPILVIGEIEVHVVHVADSDDFRVFKDVLIVAFPRGYPAGDQIRFVQVIQSIWPKASTYPVNK